MNRYLSVFGILILCFLFSCKKPDDDLTPVIPNSNDSNIVTITNGYGSGTYKVGDTVHIFSKAYGDHQLFDQWTGDISLLDASKEWHTWFIMPNKSIAISGSIKNIPAFVLNYEQIMGKHRLKPVYSYFPVNYKGIVYLLHGTNGSAASVVNGYEFYQLIKDLVTDNYGVIITEAEESTTGIDSSGDGKLRWQSLPLDTNKNVDFANIAAISDTFYNRGIADRSKPRYSIGMSDGGFFSAILSSVFHFKAGVQYCAQGGAAIIQKTTVPIQFCMARYDNNESIGAAGNAAALSNSKALNARGVCSKFYIKERCPLYPERFARSGELTIPQSSAVFNELKSNGLLDSKNYFKGYSDVFIDALKANPSKFPLFSSLAFNQKTFVLAQINLSVSDHHMYSDYNRATLKFLNFLCQ